MTALLSDSNPGNPHCYNETRIVDYFLIAIGSGEANREIQVACKPASRQVSGCFQVWDTQGAKHQSQILERNLRATAWQKVPISFPKPSTHKDTWGDFVLFAKQGLQTQYGVYNAV